MAGLCGDHAGASDCICPYAQMRMLHLTRPTNVPSRFLDEIPASYCGGCRQSRRILLAMEPRAAPVAIGAILSVQPSFNLSAAPRTDTGFSHWAAGIPCQVRPR